MHTFIPSSCTRSILSNSIIIRYNSVDAEGRTFQGIVPTNNLLDVD